MWLSKIKQAIDDGTLEFHCQPVEQIGGTGEQGIYEVLVRLRQPDRLVYAAEFIEEIIKYPEVLKLIDRAAIDTCINSPIAIHTVNLSSASLSDQTLAGYISRVFEKAGRDPVNTWFEVTENFMLNPEALGTIAALKAAGFKVGLDDFGVGYNGLLALVKVKPDFLKISGALVSEIGTTQGRVAVKLSMAAGMELKIPVIAERIENAGIRNDLMGIKDELMRDFEFYGQGWLFGKGEPC
jgi:EAL domain-containing protein (putative c-di-GMP-specific phosphodiesterase class I)